MVVLRCRYVRVVSILYRRPNFVILPIEMMSCTKTIII
jgi:hypothetical protein